MHLAPPRILSFTDAAGAVVLEFPMPSLAQIEDCVKLDLPSPDAAEAGVDRHRRMLEQLLVLVSPHGLPAAEREARAGFLRSLQYHQLLDLRAKVLLTVQGIDFDTIEEFEAALAAQKKSTPTAPPSPEPKSSPGSAISPSVSP